MADDLVPSEGQRLSRDALERIIHRAAELQANQREIGDKLTEHEVLELGREVGIPTRHLQQALLEERTRAVTAGDRGLLTTVAGPKRVSAERTVPGNRSKVEPALSHWMIDVELLSVKRRYPQGTSWEARKDWLAAVKRGMGVGGRRYALARAKEIVGQVQNLEDGWCHVTLVADLSNTRNERVGGGAAFFGSGAAMTMIGVVLGVAIAVAAIPAVVGAAGGYAIARSNRSQVERVHVAMEQVLDKLEHGEIERPMGLLKPEGRDFVKKLTAEIKEIGKHFGS